MRLPILLVLIILCAAPHARAEDSIFTSTTVLKGEALRLGNEGLEVIETPVDVKGNGLVGTLAVAGGRGSDLCL